MPDLIVTIINATTCEILKWSEDKDENGFIHSYFDGYKVCMAEGEKDITVMLFYEHDFLERCAVNYDTAEGRSLKKIIHKAVKPSTKTFVKLLYSKVGKHMDSIYS